MPPAASPLPGAPDGAAGSAARFRSGGLPGGHGRRRALPPDSAHAVAGSRQAAVLARRRFAAGAASRDRQAWGEAAAALFTPAALPPAWMFAKSRMRQRLTTSAAAGHGAGRSGAGCRQPEPPGLAQAAGPAAGVVHPGDRRGGLWIIDQHVAHERVLFEKILRDRQVEKVQRQRLLMPLLVELKPGRWWYLPASPRSWSATALRWSLRPADPGGEGRAGGPGRRGAGADARRSDRAIERPTGPKQAERRMRILTRCGRALPPPLPATRPSRSIPPLTRHVWNGYCWNLQEPNHPTSCPHGRPIALLYSWKEIQRAFHRI